MNNLEQSPIQFINPCRAESTEMPVLTASYCEQSLRKGKIVQVNLDNSSIQRMELLSNDPTYDEARKVGLAPLVNLLQTSSVALTAIGVIEMPDRYIDRARQAHESFCRNFWPGHKDSDDSSNKSFDPSSTQQKVDFKSLSDKARATYGTSYVSMLHIQHVLHAYEQSSPQEKFEAYLNGIISMIDIVSGFELEIAKYAFFPIQRADRKIIPDAFFKRRKDLKANFFSRGSTLEKCRSNAFDAAMDIYWLNVSNSTEDMQEGILIGKKKFLLDNWVATNDQKLYRISHDINHIFYEGSQLKKLEVTREPELRALPYWCFVDQRANAILNFRRSNLKRPSDLEFLSNIDNAVSYIEKSLKNIFGEST